MPTYKTNGFSFDFDDNTGKVLEALKKAKHRGLFACGMAAAEHARENYNRQGIGKPTSATYNSIDFVVSQDDDSVIVGANGAAIYLEYGSGIENVEGGTPKPYWVYMGDDGEFHVGKPQKPKPFIKPAAAEHGEEYRDIMKKSFENV